jgi:hypothetical protein
LACIQRTLEILDRDICSQIFRHYIELEFRTSRAKLHHVPGLN